MTPSSVLRLLLSVLFLIPTALPAAADNTPDFVVMAAKLNPAVVNISTSKTVRPQPPQLPGQRQPGPDFFEDFFERFFRGLPQQPRKERSLGSGFIISEDGFILTNEHVVDGADEVEVKLTDGRTFTAGIKGLDSKLDLALLKIETEEKLPVVLLGNSDELKVGEWVMAIGNPFGLDHTVTVGIVSAKGRVIGAGPYDDFIQTDASINPGNSGGPLFNTRGEVVGINTAIIAQGQGIGFAIPINAANQVLPQLRTTGRVVRGWLGVSVQQLTEELAESFGLNDQKGALVSDVIKDSPADRAGVERGDIILSFDGKPIEEMNDLPRIVATTPVGDKVKMTVLRNGKERTLTVKIGQMEETGEGLRGSEAEEQGQLGLKVAELTPERAQAYNLQAEKGLIITGVDPAGPASDANLRPGDLILEVNGQQMEKLTEFSSLLGKVKKGEVLRLLIQRNDNLFYTTIKAE